MIIRKAARPTLTAVEMDGGDTLEFTLADGQARRVELLSTAAKVLSTDVEELKVEKPGARTNYEFTCRLRIDGTEYDLRRVVSFQESFYEPWEIAGMRIWFDTVDDIFEFLVEGHGECRPHKQARFGIQDATLRICPEKLHPWCPLPEGGLKIEDCYNGEDCWLGAYFGASVHGGLDINHPKGTPLWAPLDIHDHWLFNSLAAGDNNNRWRGLHHWQDGSTWILQSHHMTELLIEEHEPFAAGTHYAVGAGVLPGSHEHSHFVFRVADDDGEVMLDPWILFRQMYRDVAGA